MDDAIENIAVVNSEVEAELLDAILTERGIPHVMKCYHDSALDGLFQRSRGWGHVEAAPKHAEEILEVMEEIAAQAVKRNAESDGAAETEG